MCEPRSRERRCRRERADRTSGSASLPHALRPALAAHGSDDPGDDPADAGARPVVVADRPGLHRAGAAGAGAGVAHRRARRRSRSATGAGRRLGAEPRFAGAVRGGRLVLAVLPGLGAAGRLPGVGQRPVGVLVRRRHPGRRPAGRVRAGLGYAGTVVGVAIGGGALLSGGLVALGPIGPVSALTVPVLAAIVRRRRRWSRWSCCLSKSVRPRGFAALRASVARRPG